MRAASTRSRGIVRKNWRKRKMKNGLPRNAGATSGTKLSTSPSRRQIVEDRHHRHLPGQHHGGQHDEEDRVPPPPAQDAEAVGHQRTGQDRPQDRQGADQQRVAEEHQHRHARQALLVVLEGRLVHQVRAGQAVDAVGRAARARGGTPAARGTARRPAEARWSPARRTAGRTMKLSTISTVWPSIAVARRRRLREPAAAGRSGFFCAGPS